MRLGSGIPKNTHPDPGAKKAPDPGSTTAGEKEERQRLPKVIDKMQLKHRGKAKDITQNKDGGKKDITCHPLSSFRHYSSYLSN
jgi:hypothetical protein